MGRLGITYLDVFKAASELKDKGLNPTVDAVRATLGTGSKSTIVPHLRQWRARCGLKAENFGANKPELPPDLLTVVKEWYQNFNRSSAMEIYDLKAQLSNLLLKNEELTQKLYQTEKEKQFLIKEKIELKVELKHLEKILIS